MASLQNPSRRPRLSLQIKTSCSPATKSSRSYAVDPRDPTAFNTLSNVYVTAIERSTPIQTEPVTAINTLQSFNISTPVEQQQQQKNLKQRVVTPYVASYPETPVTAHATSPPQLDMIFPSAMTATPPLSAGPEESKVFTFSSADTFSCSATGQGNVITSPVESRSARRRALSSALQQLPPYTHPRTLHSILRNSPLPPNTARLPPSPRRQSLRLQEKAAKRVGYNNPLTQEITTNKYTKSHIDLLVEEASPSSPAAYASGEAALDLALAFAPNEIEDGGQTPGPFEDMRRRMAGLASNNPVSPAGPAGIRKRKRKEKKRRWVWTIGQDGENDDDDDENVGGAVAAIRAQAAAAKRKEDDDTVMHTAPMPQIPYLETPTPSIESADSGTESLDVDMSDTSSLMSDDRGPSPSDLDLDLKTPVALEQKQSALPLAGFLVDRDTPVPPELAMPQQRDTPVPPEHV